MTDRSPHPRVWFPPMQSLTPRPRAHPSVLTSILDTVRVEGPLTRSELGARLGLARSTVSQRVDVLVDRGLLRMGEPAASTGGRRAETLMFNPLSGTVLA